MQLTTIVLVAAQAIAIMALENRALPVHTADRIYHTIIDQSPFLVERTSTITWTESTSIIDTSLPTEAPTPTISY
ncbi:hypothetical protein BDN70DRAFT_990649 [Pholiota conissans]|uniref:Uncharacterized protein n=1 Tax=Pholiota conissans TaxID=109636 RepID=A0A9P6CWK2_9AGAR|nr:hypothetical protein BDN70DRAFT_990649 [Pholiota conissans]